MKKYKLDKILVEVSRTISSSLDLEKVANLVLAESTKALKADNASLFLIDDKGHLALTRARGFDKDEIGNIKLLGGWEVINSQILARKKPIIVNDVEKDRIFRSKHLPFSTEKISIKSFLAVPLLKDGAIIGSLMVSNRRRPGHIFHNDDKKLLSALSNHIAIALLNAKLYQELKDLFLSTIKSLVKAVEAKDPYTSGHSERVMKYSIAIGEALGLKGEDLEELRLSGILHDVGKIGIKESILFKPGKLTDRQRRIIQEHPAIGKRIVETINHSDRIISGIAEHHERYNGGGYPVGIKGRDISLQGRIVAVADTYDALTTNRPYQKGYTAKEALFEILNSSKTCFDPKVVKAFVRSFSKRPEIWKA